MKNVLVCLDGSPRAPTVLATAIDLARRLDAKLTLFRSVGLPSSIDQEHAAETTASRLVEEARDALVALAAEQQVPPERLVAVDVELGVPWDAICREAQDIAADLVVIGSHGYGGLDGVLGTTAAKVVNHATASVLVVR